VAGGGYRGVKQGAPGALDEEYGEGTTGGPYPSAQAFLAPTLSANATAHFHADRFIDELL
jgi:hypothetical protein